MHQQQTIPGTYSPWPAPYRPGPQRKPWKPAHFLWALLFLAPLFISRIFIGGNFESYDQASGIGFFWLGYLVHVVIVAYYLFAARHRPQSKQLSYLIIGMLLVSSVLHAASLTVSDEAGATLGLLAIARNTLWVLCCVAISNIIDQELFLRALLWFSHFTFAIILLSTAVYYVTGIPINLILSGTLPRAQGLMSEPSAVSGTLGGYIALALARKQMKRFLLGLLIALLVNSVIAIMAVSVGIITGWLSRSKTSSYFVSPARMLVFFILPVMIIAAPIYAHEISQMANDAMNYFDETTFGQTTFYTSIIERALQAASVLETSMNNLAVGENRVDGGLQRFASIMFLVNNMTDTWHWLFGFGLGAHAQIMLAENRQILDFGLLPFLLSSYGFVLGGLLFFFIIATIARPVTPLLVFVTPFAAVSILNSAGGIHTYSVVIVATLLVLAEPRRKQFAFA